MSQQDFDNFKQSLRDWKDNHLEEYNLFEEEMNSRDAVGYQKIMNLAITIVPAYKKLITQKNNQGVFNDITDIENKFTENKLAQTLIAEFNNPNKNSIIPAMLYWLYFGQSFERMVEKGEEFRKLPNIGYLNKFVIKSAIGLLRNKSIQLGLRTKADWEKHHNLMKEVDSSEVLSLDLSEAISKKSERLTSNEAVPEQTSQLQAEKTKKTLSELLSKTTTKKPIDVEYRIEKYLFSKRTQRDIAFLKIALEELRFIAIPCEATVFREALDLQYGNIIGVRGIQKVYEELNTFDNNGKMRKNDIENREAIDAIKNILSN